ncbi:MAG: DMT family transporter [Burkholderiaceae bacterium]|jgi:drug/metabolite transporter (DMT)-like permease|nr:DMT family transporter [Burkholderiaceae bacterium]
MHHLDRNTAFLLTLPPLFWAGNAVLARMLVGEVPPLALSLLRWLLALALFLPFVWRGLMAAWPQLRAAWRDVLWISLTGVAAYNSLQYVAVQTSSAVNVTLIAAATPVFALVFGVLFFGERARGAQWVGAGLSITGVLWVLLRGDVANVTRLNFVAGDLVMIAANITWAVYTWLLRKRRPQVPFGPFLAAQMLVGTLMIVPLAIGEAALTSATIHWTPTAAAVVLYVALFPSLLAYYCWDRGVARVGAVLPVHFANLTPIFAALLSTLLLGEPPQLYHLVGLVAIVAGIQVANRR